MSEEIIDLGGGLIGLIGAEQCDFCEHPKLKSTLHEITLNSDKDGHLNKEPSLCCPECLPHIVMGPDDELDAKLDKELDETLESQGIRSSPNAAERDVLSSIMKAASRDSSYFYEEYYDQLRDILAEIEERKNK